MNPRMSHTILNHLKRIFVEYTSDKIVWRLIKISKIFKISTPFILLSQLISLRFIFPSIFTKLIKRISFLLSDCIFPLAIAIFPRIHNSRYDLHNWTCVSTLEDAMCVHSAATLAKIQSLEGIYIDSPEELVPRFSYTCKIRCCILGDCGSSNLRRGTEQCVVRCIPRIKRRNLYDKDDKFDILYLSSRVRCALPKTLAIL